MKHLVLAVGLAGVSGCVFDTSGFDHSAGDAGRADGAAADVAPLDDGALPIDATVTDAMPDGMTGCVPWDFMPTNFDPCDPTIPAPGAVDLSTPGMYFYDTGTGELARAGGMSTFPPSVLVPQAGGAPMLRVLMVDTFDLPAASSLRVQGPNPLAIVSNTTAAIAGAIDLSAFAFPDGSSLPGPGADDPSTCAAAFGADEQDSTGVSAGGGGGGGGYGGTGGDGGDGQGGGHGNKGGKGSGGGTTDLEPLRGGCAGGPGGDAPADLANPGVGGARGAGGGALQIAARFSVTVSGSIRSLGAGGGRGEPGLPTPLSTGRGGGGGAGSGGAIFLESDVVTVTATASLCANGGSGGEGSGLSGLGGYGSVGSCSESTPATTFNVSTDGGNGGAGGYRGGVNGVNGTNGAGGGGGGGGGGGAGRIRVRGVTTRTLDPTATESPQASM